MKYFLGIDFGGGASKATLLGADGEIYAENTVEYPTVYPKQGWSEQNPEEWFRVTVKNIEDILDKSGISSSDIEAVSLDAATHTAVITDDRFKPLRPAIYWTDTRSTEEVRFLKENYEELIVNTVLHNPDTIWTLPQLMWVKNNEADLFNNVSRIMFAKDYVRHKLTGDYVTDNIEAEGSMLFDYNKQCWSKELCDILGIDINILPQIVKPDDIVGGITKEAAELTGLREGTPVLCGTTDTVMEVFASGAVSKGQMTLKLATAGRICIVTDKPYPDKNMINYSHVAEGLWYPGTATKSCAASYRWYRDTFGDEYKKLDSKAEKIEAGAEGLMFHPYLNGELTPYADPLLCASFTGIRAGHTKAHFTRAVLEGAALSMLDCKTAIEKIGIEHGDAAFIIGGGGKSPLWRQITADVTGITLVQNKHSDSSFGSAMLAGIAAGAWDSPKAAVEFCNKALSVTKPNADNNKKYKSVFRRYKDIQSALQKIYHTEYEGI